MSFCVADFAAAVEECLVAGRKPVEPLTDFLHAGHGRAAGLWRTAPAELVQLAFVTADDMPGEVHSEFSAATQTVPLSSGGLGIVKAVTSGQPTLGTLDGGSSGLDGSATWLARFGALHSLAIPVRDDERILGVFALSTASRLDVPGPDVALLEQAATALRGPLLAQQQQEQADLP